MIELYRIGILTSVALATSLLITLKFMSHLKKKYFPWDSVEYMIENEVRSQLQKLHAKLRKQQEDAFDQMIAANKEAWKKLLKSVEERKK